MSGTRERIIVLIARGGLGNRFLALEACVALGKDLGARVKLVWPWGDTDGSWAGDFDKLFEPPTSFDLYKDGLVATHLKKWEESIRDFELFGRKRASTRMVARIMARIAWKTKRVCWEATFKTVRPVIDHSIGVTTNLPPLDELRTKKRIFVSAYQRFYPRRENDTTEGGQLLVKPIKELQDKIDAITEEFSRGGQTIGIHMRRGDVHSHRYIETERYNRAMEKEIERDENTRFFVCSDSAAERQEMRKRFGERIILQPNFDDSRYYLAGCRCAVVDMFALAKTSKIIGGPSTFTETVERMSKVPRQIMPFNTN